MKGTIARRYIVSTLDYPMTFGNAGSMLRTYFSFISTRTRRAANGIAHGNAYDAVNVRWRDIKNRVADDMSEEKAAEDGRLLRDAYAKSLKDSVPDR